MIQFPSHGVYGLQTEHAPKLAQQLVYRWMVEGHKQYAACIWLTPQAPAEVEAFLERHLKANHSHHKGLQVVSTQGLLEHPNQESILNLCRSLSHLMILKPAWVVIEDLELWMNPPQPHLNQSTVLHQIQTLQEWAAQSDAVVVVPCAATATTWSVYTTGLARYDNIEDPPDLMWWPTKDGPQCHLWNPGCHWSALPRHVVIEHHAQDSWLDTALQVYMARYGLGVHANTSSSPLGIHVRTQAAPQSHTNAWTHTTLLRLGADSIQLAPNMTAEDILGVHQNAIQLQAHDHKTPLNVSPEVLMQFARDLHEVCMPGQLSLHTPKTFAQGGHLMLHVAKSWGLVVGLARLSLLPHMPANTALRLSRFDSAGALWAATSEALTLLKLWASPPSAEDTQAWLASCFQNPLHETFGGQVLTHNPAEIAQMLDDLAEQNPITFPFITFDGINDIANSVLQTPEQPDVAHIWQHGAETDTTERPWLKRLMPYSTLGPEHKEPS